MMEESLPNFNKKFEDEMADEIYLDCDETYYYFIFTQKMCQINRETEFTEGFTRGPRS